jgi:hypothetical protein
MNKTPASKRVSRTTTAKAGKTSSRAKAAAPRRPRPGAKSGPRDRRFVVDLTEEEHLLLVELCDDDVRPLSSWFRITIRRAFEARGKNKKRGSTIRGVEKRETREIQVMTRLTEDERDMLDVLAGEESKTGSGWLRAMIRRCHSERFGKQRATG